jgi:hypothetical protein
MHTLTNAGKAMLAQQEVRHAASTLLLVNEYICSAAYATAHTMAVVTLESGPGCTNAGWRRGHARASPSSQTPPQCSPVSPAAWPLRCQQDPHPQPPSSCPACMTCISFCWCSVHRMLATVRGCSTCNLKVAHTPGLPLEVQEHR